MLEERMRVARQEFEEEKNHLPDMLRELQLLFECSFPLLENLTTVSFKI